MICTIHPRMTATQIIYTAALHRFGDEKIWLNDFRGKGIPVVSGDLCCFCGGEIALVGESNGYKTKFSDNWNNQNRLAAEEKKLMCEGCYWVWKYGRGELNKLFKPLSEEAKGEEKEKEKEKKKEEKKEEEKGKNGKGKQKKKKKQDGENKNEQISILGYLAHVDGLFALSSGEHLKEVLFDPPQPPYVLTWDGGDVKRMRQRNSLLFSVVSYTRDPVVMLYRLMPVVLYREVIQRYIDLLTQEEKQKEEKQEKDRKKLWREYYDDPCFWVVKSILYKEDSKENKEKGKEN